MKKNKININKIAILLAASTLSMSACRKDITSLNNNPNALTVLDATSLNYLFSTTQYYGIAAGQGVGSYQLFQSLFTDQRAQYFSCVQTTFPSDRNVMVGNWLNGSWTQLYLGQGQMHEILNATAEGGKLANKAINAITRVWKVYSSQLLTDAYGPVPYLQVNNLSSKVPYDSQKDIYNDFFKELKEAVEILNSVDEKSGLGNADLFYAGNTKLWLKFANTLHLRVAMRISAVEPALAQQEAEAACTAPGGLLESVADNALLKVDNNTQNPLSGISAWGEFRMSAAMQSVLQGFNDPRMTKYFAPAKSSNKFKGVRNGMSIDQMQRKGNNADDNSNIAVAIGFDNKGTAPYPILTAAETYFLLAEAKLKGWNVGAKSAKDYYEAGVKASMEQWKVEANLVDAYLSGMTTPVALDDEFKTPALSDITVAFANDPNKQLEQIVTQKWLALFPVSPEAWAEYRRTGFPKLYPRITNENQDASLDPNSVHRLTYPPIEYNNNSAGYQSGVQLLGGKGDKVSTKVWWDVSL